VEMRENVAKNRKSRISLQENLKEEERKSSQLEVINKLINYFVSFN